ncbi:MAG: D-cysteine desulfhydrase family protein [Chloroflexota bacterium]|nr:D-cysteine desulfhydrase family protein [Chloroflexota bacterium]
MSEAYQNLIPPHPRVRLTSLPSPLERATGLEDALRAEGAKSVPRLYLKRDDLLSLGLGGNKIRNLEFSIARALDEGATDVITSGRQQSNHCRLTAAACARTPLSAHLVFSGDRPATLTGSLLLDELLGAKTYFCGSADRSARAKWVDLVAFGIEAFGRRPHVIPVGGSDARGALGHVLAAAELLDQLKTLGERPGAIVLATATGGTQAGMLAGLAKLGVAVPVYGYAVAKSANDLRADVLRLAAEVAADIEGPPVDSSLIHLDGAMLGGGYGNSTPEAEAAIRLLARTEGVFADPVYTGKALAGLLALIRDARFGSDEAVVFVHTGGAPALFAA